METEQLSVFLDNLIDAAYNARCFKKEDVAQILGIAAIMKNKFADAEKLTAENTELHVKLEILEAENKKYIERFKGLDQAIEDSNHIHDVNEIEVVETAGEDLTPAAVMEKKLFGSTNNLPKKTIPQKLQK